MKEGEDLMEMQKKHGEVGGGRVMHRAIADAIAGTLAGGVSRTIVSPLDVIKIRFQAGAAGANKYTPPFLQCRCKGNF
jgi:hypothetical protein